MGPAGRTGAAAIASRPPAVAWTMADHATGFFGESVKLSNMFDNPAFSPKKPVDKINIITDRDTDRSKGFGFVEMPDSAAAKAAIQGLNGKDLAGRALNVNEAKPREPRPAASRSRW